MRMDLDSRNCIRVANDYQLRSLGDSLSNVKLNAHFRDYFAIDRVREL